MKKAILVILASYIFLTNVSASTKSEQLLRAIESQNLYAVDLLVRNGINTNKAAFSRNTTPLMHAVEVGSYEIVKRLIEYGANTDVKDQDGNTPLIQSIKSHRNKIAFLLIENSKNINSRTKEGTTALQYAARQGDEGLFKKILLKGGNLKVFDIFGNNTLFYAISGRNKNIINNLIAMKYFNLSHTNISGENALGMAEFYGLNDVVKVLSKGRNNNL